MHTNRAITRPSSESVSMRPIGDRQTPVKTLPSLAVGNNLQKAHVTGAGAGPMKLHIPYWAMLCVSLIYRPE